MENFKKKNVSGVVTSRCAVVVLGMHRSGTSALSGLLMKLGGDGPVSPLAGHADNPLGHFESRVIVQCHDALLTSAGTSWDDYMPFPNGALSFAKMGEHQNHLKNALDSEFGRSDFFVLKDPRICRLVPFWLDIFAEMKIQPLFIHTHRKPAEVAQSLLKRNGFEREYSHLLWLRHILDAEIGSRGQMRSFTSYDRLLKGWPAEIEKFAAELDISWPKYNRSQLPELGAMIQPDLKHHTSQKITHSKVFSTWFHDTFDVFERWAEHGEDTNDHLILDRIRQDFNESVRVFAGTVHAKRATLAQKHDAALEELTSDQNATLVDRDDPRAQTEERQATVEALMLKNSSLTEELSLSRSMLGQRKAELDDTIKELQVVEEALSQEKLHSANLMKDLSLSEARLQALEATQAKRAHYVGRVQKMILDYQNELADARAQYARQEQVLNDKSRKLDETKKAHDETKKAHDETKKAHKAAVKKLTKHTIHLEKTVQEYLRSTSWRITGPLRWLARRFRK